MHLKRCSLLRLGTFEEGFKCVLNIDQRVHLVVEPIAVEARKRELVKQHLGIFPNQEVQ